MPERQTSQQDEFHSNETWISRLERKVEVLIKDVNDLKTSLAVLQTKISYEAAGSDKTWQKTISVVGIVLGIVGTLSAIVIAIVK